MKSARPILTLFDLLQAGENGHAAVIIPELGVRTTYDSLRQQVLAMADAFAAAGIRRGDRVAIALPNGLPAIVSFLAATIAGTAAPLNPAYRYDEFCFFLEDAGARILICSPGGNEEARRAAANHRIPVLSVEMNAEGHVHMLEAPKGASPTMPSLDDVALILHTSGSTGMPKRVPLRHANLLLSARNISDTYQLSPEDAGLCVMPLFHVHGLVASALATLLSGGTLVLSKRFDALAFWRFVREYRVSWYSGVPAMHQLLLVRAGHKGKPPGTESLRFIRSCSMSLPPAMMLEMENAFGVPLIEAYGMTEAAHQMTSNPLPPGARKPSSVGIPAGVKVNVLDANGGRLQTGERGEVAVQGPSVFRGYENNPEANASCFAEGWFRTGDEGFLDAEGYLHLTGRLRDVINRAGEKISPHLIDRVLQAHPSVAEAVTFGFAHPKLGEEVAAAVVLCGLGSETDLVKHCHERLAEFECPKKIYIVDSIPRTATGKIRRRAVAEALMGDPK